VGKGKKGGGGGGHGNSIKNPRVYEALKRKGMSKHTAAAISNGMLHKGKKGKR
jgi:hypothetical protein